MKLLGLTGNFGMGKSTAGRFFSELGVLVIDTDQIVKELFNDKAVQEALIEMFGRDIIVEGVVNKKAIAEIVFNSQEKRTSLEDLLHPLVFKRIDEIVSENQDKAMIIVEAPLIFERGYEKRFDYVINVFCSNDLAVERLKNKGYTEQEAQQRLNTQMPYEQKNRLSQFVIDNNSSEAHLRDEVKRIFLELERTSYDNNKRSP